MSPWTPILSTLSPAGRYARLSVFIFHRVLPEPDPLFPGEPDVVLFDRMVSWIKARFNVLPADEAVRRLSEGSLPARAACITFDDGYADNCTLAMPILQRHGLTATFFIATGFLDGGRMWNDTVIESLRTCRKTELDLSHLGFGAYRLVSLEERRTAIGAILSQLKYRLPVDRLGLVDAVADASGEKLPNDLMMTSEQVCCMRGGGMLIGAHTITHPILARLAPEEVRREIADSKFFLENLLNERIGLFAYPNGKPGQDYRQSDAEIVRDVGFDAAFSTEWGAASQGGDLMHVPRFTPWDRQHGKFAMRMALHLAKSRL